VDIFTALRTVEANATIPIIIMGWLDGGWLIHHLLTRHQHVLGYLHRHDDFSQHLAPALAAVTRSKSYLSPAAQALVSEAQRLGLTNHKFGPDEIAVLRGLARGETRGHIATQLGVPVSQVHTITRRMRRLLDVPSTEVLILRAREWGIC
jgi:DNA-binding NarL/FixJ family response regulator